MSLPPPPVENLPRLLIVCGYRRDVVTLFCIVILLIITKDSFFSLDGKIKKIYYAVYFFD